MSKHFFTIDPTGKNNHPVHSVPGAMLEHVFANDIQEIPSDAFGAKFFKNQVKIQPEYLIFNEVQLLISEKRDITIQNVGKKQEFIIDDVFSSTPELMIFYRTDSNGKNILLPGESLTITVLFVPETINLIQGCIYISFNSRYIFMAPVTAFVVENKFGLKPIYYNDVNLN